LIHVCKVIWLYSPPFALLPPSRTYPQKVPTFHSCHLFLRTRFCIWERTFHTLTWVYDHLSHSTWWSLVSSIFPQTIPFHSSLWLSNTPLCTYTTVLLPIHWFVGTQGVREAGQAGKELSGEFFSAGLWPQPRMSCVLQP
jgi:hypothetical protein